VSISEPFIRRPVATSLLAVAMLLAGLLAYLKLPVAPLPRVDFPTISVDARLPGAGPETMASAVATPLERRFGRIAGVTEITSTSSLGDTSITLQFDLDRDVEGAARDVQAAINAASAELPSGMPARPRFRKVNPADSPTLILSLQSDTIPLPEVYDRDNQILVQQISEVEGVGDVFVGGGKQPAVRVEIDPEALAGAALSSADVREAISSSTANSPKGAFDGSRQGAVLSANDQLFDAEHFKRVVVSYKDGAAVHLEDVANVVESVENERIAGWVDQKPAVLLLIRRQPGANIIETNERVKELLPRFRQVMGPATKLEVVFDRTKTIRSSVRGVQVALGASVVLVVLVVFAFLRSARATAVPSVAVPLSLFATFGVMYLLDYSLDNLSLMALTISTGFVVDDAIVVTENVARYIELGHSPMEAALKGAKEIGFTIVSITVSLLAVFIPILAMGGIIGRLFREFAVTLAVAVAVSAIISLTLTPMMCSRLLRSERDVGHGRLYHATEWLFETMRSVYGRMLRFVLRHRYSTLAVTIATIGATVYLYVVVPKGLFPQQDTGQLMGSTEAAEDASFPRLKEHQEEVNAVIAGDPDIDHFVSFVGSGGRSGNSGRLFIGLKDDRKASADEIIGRLRPKLDKIAGIKGFMQSMQDVRIGGRSAKTQYQYTLEDTNLDELREWAPKLVDALSKLPELKDVTSDQQTGGLELDVGLDRDTLSRVGLGPTDVDGALYDAFGQRQIATTYTEMGQKRVVIVEKPSIVGGPESVDSVYVKTPTGELVALAGLTKKSYSETPLAIPHQGQFPATTISFNLAPGVALGPAVDAIERTELEIGMPASVHAGFKGTAQAFASSLATEPLHVLLAHGSDYIVHGVVY
jgi:multidrug efflux pump subunit AcrB